MRTEGGISIGNRVRMSDLTEGERALAEEVRSREGMAGRLAAIGLSEGAQIECVLRRPSGGIAAYRIRGALMALRAEDAALITVIRAGG